MARWWYGNRTWPSMLAFLRNPELLVTIFLSLVFVTIFLSLVLFLSLYFVHKLDSLGFRAP